MVLLVIATISFSLLVLAWVVYPAMMWVRTRRVTTRPEHQPTPGHSVSVVVATRDDPSFALERVQNLRTSTYPAHLLSIVVAVDANSAQPLAAYQAVLGNLADVVPGDAPGGKAATLNAGVRAAKGADVLIFADVGQEFNAAAIGHLVAALRDGDAGAVTGRYTHARTDELMSTYADLEALIRAGQSAGRSVVSATGAILGMRQEYWRDLPSGLICDDLFTGLSVVRQGSRVSFCPEAVAYDPRVFSREQQFARRVRTLTGLIQYCMTQPGVLLPWSNPVWGHFFVHKVLRLLTPLLFAAGALAIMAWLILLAPIPALVVAVTAAAAVLALRLIAPATFARLSDQAGWAARLMVVPVVAIANGIRGRWTVWTPTSQVRAGLHRRGA